MLKQTMAVQMLFSLALLAGCGGGDEPKQNGAGGAAPAGGNQAESGQGAAGAAGPGPTSGTQAAGGAAQGAAAAQNRGQGSAAGTPVRNAAATAVRASGQPVPAGAVGGLAKFVPAETTVALVLRPAETLTRKPLADLELEQHFEKAIEATGVDIRNVERILILGWADPNAEITEQPPQGGAVVRFKQPYNLEQLGGTERPMDQWQETTVAGRKAYQVDEATIVPVDDRTLVITQEASAPKLLAAGAPRSSLLLDALAAEGQKHDLFFVSVLTPAAKQQLPPRDQVPPQMQQFVDLAQHLEIVTVQADLSPGVSIRLTATADSPQWAQKIQQLAGTGVFFASAGIASLKQQLTESPPPDMTPEQLETVFRILDQVLEGAQPRLTGNTVEVALTAPEELNPILEEYLPKLMMALEGEAVGSAERTRSMNNLKQIAIAFHNHHDTHGSLPAQANYEGETPLLSWRVHVLPFLGERALYEQFRLDEPWDSEHNRALLEQMPDLFASAGADSLEPGHTPYLAVTGKGTAFEGQQGRKFSEFRDGMSNSIIVVEAAPEQAVPWTKPEDLDIDAAGTLDKLLSGGEGFLALFADGSARPIAGTIDGETLRKAFTISDGNPINLD